MISLPVDRSRATLESCESYVLLLISRRRSLYDRPVSVVLCKTSCRNIERYFKVNKNLDQSPDIRNLTKVTAAADRDNSSPDLVRDSIIQYHLTSEINFG